MKVQDLIRELSVLSPTQEVMILDGTNGGGVPRTINLQATRFITKQDAGDACDCADLVGQQVAVLGYGCY